MKNKPTIEVSNLFFGYEKKDLVLRSVSFTVQKGEFLGVIGPNGGGKSTLLKLLLGLLQPTEGTILINGLPPRNSSLHMAYVPQSFSFDKAFPITVLEVVLGGRLRHTNGTFSKSDTSIAKDALASTGLSHLENNSFGSLSRGQAQRVFIARALASESTILFLDEPTSSSDQESEKKMLEIIMQLKDSITILMVTHNVSSILSHVQGVLCVCKSVTKMNPKDICEHFALGLYHVPMIETATNQENLSKGKKIHD